MKKRVGKGLGWRKESDVKITFPPDSVACPWGPVAGPNPGDLECSRAPPSGRRTALRPRWLSHHLHEALQPSFLGGAQRGKECVEVTTFVLWSPDMSGKISLKREMSLVTRLRESCGDARGLLRLSLRLSKGVPADAAREAVLKTPAPRGPPWSLPAAGRRGLAGRPVRTERQLQECVCRYPARRNGVHAGGIRKGKRQGEGGRKVPRPGRVGGNRGELSLQPA